MTLRTETELAVSGNMVVTISGLRCDSGQCSICNNATLSLHYLSPTTGFDLYHSAEYLVNGDLVLTLISDVPANATVIFTFCLDNPLAGQSSPRMYIESNGIVFPRAEMRRGLKGAAPLSVAGFSTARIGQSTPAHLTSNALTVTLNAFASLPKGALLVFSGLHGLRTPSSIVPVTSAAPAFPASSSELAGLQVETNVLSFLSSRAMWNSSTAELTLTLENEIDYNTFYIFSINLENGDAGQESQQVHLNVSFAGQTLVAVNLTTDTGNRAVLLIAKFLTTNIFQVTAVPASINNVTISFSLNSVVSVQDDAYLAISGFDSVRESVQDRFAISDVGSNATDYFGAFGTCDENGTLIFPVQRNTLPGVMYSFTFELRNPRRGQDSPDFLIEFRGFRISPTSMQRDQGTSAPLRVAGFRTASIGQSTACASAENTITVTLNFFMTVPYQSASSDVRIVDPNATLIRIVGWSGNDPASTFTISQYRLNGTVLDMPFIPYFNRTTSELLLRIRNGSNLVAELDHVLDIQIQNGNYGQESPTFIVRGEGGASMSHKTMDRAAYDKAPLVIAGIRTGIISQSSTLASGNNTIQVSLSFFTFIQNGTIITIAGLEGTQTMAATLSVHQNASVFAASGAWTQATGSFVLEVVKTIEPFGVAIDKITFAFTVQNPEEGRYPPNVSFTATYTEACTRYGAASDVVILRTPLEHAPGNKGALRIAGFEEVTLHQQSASTNVDNMLFLNMISFVTIPVGSIITLQGITCARCRCVECCRLHVHDIFIGLTESHTDIVTFKDTHTTESALLQGQLVELELSEDVEEGVPYSFRFRIKNNDCGQEPLTRVELKVGYDDDFSGDGVTTPFLNVRLGVRHAAPFLINYFPNMIISQNSTATLAANQISIAFSTRAPLSNATVVQVLDLLETETESGPIMLLGPDSSKFAGAVWNNEEGVLSLTWGKNGSNATQVYEIYCIFRNPPDHQLSPAVKMVALDPVAMTTPEETDKGTGIAAPLLINEFVDLLAFQGTPAPGGQNNITIRFRATAAPADIFQVAKTKITIRGLTITETPDSSAFSVQVEGGHDIFNKSSSWDQSTGTLVLSVIGPLHNDRVYQFTFNVTNPFEAQLPAQVYISSSGVETTEVEIPGAQGIHAPLVVLVQMSTKFAWQSTPSANARNTITVTLASTYGMVFEPDMQITIKGLTGSATPSATNVPISCNETFPCAMDWDQTLGQAIITTSATISVGGLEPFILSFNVTNPAIHQESPAISIKIDRILSDWTELDKSDDHGKIHAPLQIAGFTSVFLNQTTASQLAVNTLNLRFSLQTNLYSGTRILLSGLQGVTTPSGDIEVVCEGKPLNGTDVVDAGTFFRSPASWNQSTEVLTIDVISETPSDHTYTISFNVDNPGFVGQDGPTDISIRSDGEIVMTNRHCKGGPGSAQPLLIADFIVKKVSQQSASVNAENVISVTFSTRASLIPGSEITLRGLTRTTNPFDGYIPIDTDDIAHLDQNALWSRDAGELVVSVMQSTVARREYVFSFVLTNPEDGQDSPIINISSSGIRIMPIAVESAYGNYAPLLIARFVVANISQSAPGQDVDNTFIVWLSTNVDIYGACPAQPLIPGQCSSIRLTGLGGATTLSTDDLGIFSREGKLSNSSRWMKESTSIDVKFKSDLEQRRLLYFQFTLHNPPTFNDAQDVYVQLQGSIQSKTYLMDPGQGAKAPLLVIGLLQKDIRQSTPSVRAQNTITIVVKSTFSLPANMLLTVTGLVGSVTGKIRPDSATSLLSNTSRVPCPFGCVNSSVCRSRRNRPVVSLKFGGFTAHDSAMGVYYPILQSDPSRKVYAHQDETWYLQYRPSNSAVGACSASFWEVSSRIGPDMPWPSRVQRMSFEAFNASFLGQVCVGTWCNSTCSHDCATLHGDNRSSHALCAYECFLALDSPLNITDLHNFSVFQLCDTNGDLLNASGPWYERGVDGSWILQSSALVISVPDGANMTNTTDSASCMLCPPNCSLTLPSSSLGGDPINVTLLPEQSGNFSNVGIWNWSLSSIVLQTIAETKAMEPYTISFVLQNGEVGQLSPDVTIFSNDPAYRLLPTLMDKGTRNEAPLLIAKFSTKFIQQETPSASSKNFLTVTLESIADLVNGTKITISGLAGVDTPDDDSLQINATSAFGAESQRHNESHPFGKTGVWHKSRNNGTLIVTVSEGKKIYGENGTFTGNVTEPIMEQNRLYSFVFMLRNGAQYQEAPSISIESSGTDTTKAKMEYGASNEAPLLIAGFRSLIVGQSTVSQSTPYTHRTINSITVTFSTNVQLKGTEGCRLTLSGLTGTLDPRGENESTSIYVAGEIRRLGLTRPLVTHDFGLPCPCPNIGQRGCYCGEWNSQNGTMVFPMQHYIDSVLGAEYRLKFEVVNPMHGQDAAFVSASGSGITISQVLAKNAPGNAAPLLIADFLIKRVGQSTPSALANNTISVTIRTRAALMAGTRITVSGLTGSLTDDSALDLYGNSTALLGGSGVWTRQSASFVATLQSDSDAAQLYVYRFVLKNPSTGQPPPPVYIESGGSTIINRTSVVAGSGNNVPMGIAQWSASAMRIGQMIPHASALNIIQVTLQISIALPPGAAVTISGLTGSDTPDGPMPMIDKGEQFVALLHQPYTDLGPMWNQERGELVFTLKKESKFGQEYQFAFNLRNSPLHQESPSVSIEVGGSIIVMKSEMFRDSGNKAPMLVAGFPVKEVNQSTPGLGDVNTITVNLVSNIMYDVVLDVDQRMFHRQVRAMTIRITNLRGAATESQTQFPLNLISPAAQLSLPQTAYWNQTTGVLFITIPRGRSIHAGAAMVFSFELLNPLEPQMAPEVNVEADGTVSHVEVSSYEEATLVTRYPMVVRADLGHDAPLQIAGFCIRWIGQSTVSQTFRSVAHNTITVSIVPTVGFRAAASHKITIGGLEGSLTPDNEHLPIRAQMEVPTAPKAGVVARCCEVCGVGALQSASHILGSTGRWNQTLGSLSLDVQEESGQGSGGPYRMYIIQFDLVNPREGHDAAASEDLFISSSGIIVAPRSFELGVPNCQNWNIQCGVRSYGNEAPMLTADFLVADISQSTPSANATNTISFVFSTRASLVQNTAVSLVGLTGSITVETSLVLTGNATEIFGTEGEWNQTTGTLVLHVTNRSIADALYVLDFNLTNPSHGQDAPFVTAETSGAVVIGTTRVMAAPGNRAPMLVADFLIKKIGQSHASQSVLNTISVTIATRVEMPVGSNITISGFSHGMYSLPPVLALHGMSSTGIFYTGSAEENLTTTPFTTPFATQAPMTTPAPWFSGTWNQEKSYLVVTLDRDLESRMLYTFSFEVLNPDSSHQSPSIFIESSGISISRTRMEKDPGNSAPGTVAGFVSTFISQSSADASSSNTLSIQFSINVYLPPGHIVRIVNLSRAVPHGSLSSVPVSTDTGVFNDTATWTEQGHILSVTTTDTLEAFTPYRINVTLINPPAGQPSPNVQAKLSGQIQVANTQMVKATGLQAPLAILSLFPIAILSQSTTVPGASNTLTLDLRSRDTLFGTQDIQIILAGLRGATNDGSPCDLGVSCLDVSITGGDCNYMNRAKWTKETGELVLHVEGQVTGNVTCVLQFEVTNSMTAQFSPQITLTASPILFIPRQVDRGSDNSAPLLIAGFLKASLNQSNPFMGNQNRLFFSFSTTVSLLSSESARIRLSGLKGSLTATTTDLPICDQQCMPSGDVDAVEQCCSYQLGRLFNMTTSLVISATNATSPSNSTEATRQFDVGGTWIRDTGVLVVSILKSTMPGKNEREGDALMLLPCFTWM